MSKSHTLASVLLLLTSCMGQGNGNINPKLASMYVGTVLYQAESSGSLIYSGYCYDSGQSSDFPQLHLPQNRGASPLQMLREMFANDSRMQVTQEPGGAIRMVETDVRRDILDLKIHHISFAQYPVPISSPNVALLALLLTPEVKAFMTARKIGPPLRGIYRASIPYSSDSPHISGDLDNVTVSQALDYVLRTYPGFWAYENCLSESEGRTVFIRFFPTVRPGPVRLP
jgi:hypothetical protein